MSLDPNDIEQVRAIFEAAKAIITDSHFVYTPVDGAWYHGSTYINKDAVFTDPIAFEELAIILAQQLVDLLPEVVVVPRGGAIALGSRVAFHLTHFNGKTVYAVYADEVDGEEFVLKRGYDKIVAGRRCVVLDDILKSGRSLRNVVRATVAAGGNVIGAGALANRGKVTAGDVEAPALVSLLDVELTTYAEEHCPLCAGKIPVRTDLGHGVNFLRRTAHARGGGTPSGSP